VSLEFNHLGVLLSQRFDPKRRTLNCYHYETKKHFSGPHHWGRNNLDILDETRHSTLKLVLKSNRLLTC